jgi:hypothetical protein
MKKLLGVLTIFSAACMFSASIGVIFDVLLYVYIFAPLGMILSVSAWIISKRERDAIRRRLGLSFTDREWIDAMNAQAREIAIHSALPMLGEIEEGNNR